MYYQSMIDNFIHKITILHIERTLILLNN